METSLVHGEGDAMGQPFQVAKFWRYILNRALEYDPRNGRLLYDRILIGCGKGNSKTEMEAAFGLSELLGPIAPISPHVVVSAASWDQANKLFGAARDMINEGPLARHFGKDQILEDRILRPDRPGKLRRIAAVAATNDGDLPTCHIGDEIHEWRDGRERVFTIYGNGLKKRTPRAELPDGRIRVGSQQIAITTASDELDTLCGRLYEHGKKVSSGEVLDERFLMLWWEASEHWDLRRDDQLVQAILEANPAAGSFLSIENLVDRYHDPLMQAHEYDRYHLNRFAQAPEKWLSEVEWNDRLRKDKGGRPQTAPPPAHTSIGIGFDGSDTRDSTALYGCTLDSYVFKIGVWQRDPRDASWHVPRAEVDAAVDMAFDRWDVVRMQCDPRDWMSEIQDWVLRYGENKVVGVPQTNERMAPMADRFRAAVLTKTLTHDGDVVLRRHVGNCHTRNTRWGLAVRKDHPDSPRKIDAAVAAMLAKDAAGGEPDEGPSIYETRGVLTI